MYVNSDVNVLSFEGNFVTLHLGTVLIVDESCFCTYKDTNQLSSYQLFPYVSCASQRSPFHRYDDDEGSRSVAERFVTVIITKPSQAHLLHSVVTFHVANIVTCELKWEKGDDEVTANHIVSAGTATDTRKTNIIYSQNKFQDNIQ
jgi:hypothetical protein